MKELTITEKYALCMLKEQGKLNKIEIRPHLIVSMIVEMMLNGNVEITDKNKVNLKENLPTKGYNRKLYEIIQESRMEVPLKSIVTSICGGISDRKIINMIELLQESMLEKGLISREMTKGLLGNKEVIIVNENEVNCVIEEVRAEFLEKGNLTEDFILLGSLLNATKFLKNIFTKYEKETLKKRLEEIKGTEIAKKVKVAQSVIDDMIAIYS